MIPNKDCKKIIVILGPTSSGKSEVAIKLAKKFNGEIISADSRQIYRGLDIGSGKVIFNPSPKIKRGIFHSLPSGEMSSTRGREGKVLYSEGIPHYGIDIAGPRTDYSVAKFKKYADKKITEILQRGKLPIICGGTGFWLKAIIDDIVYPEVKPDLKLREKLEKKSTEELFAELKKLDPERAKTIDAKNPVRLIRAIEICKTLGKVPELNKKSKIKNQKFIQIGINLPKEKLHENIKKRLQKRFQSGMIEEVERLHFKDKLNWKNLESFGLGYKLIPQYIKGEIKNKKDLFEKTYLAEKDYAKRQLTWFKKDKRIIWISKYQEIEKEIRRFMKS